MKKSAICICLSALFLFSGWTVFAQDEKKPEHLTKETFLKKVWDYEKNPNEFKYLGDKPCIIDFYANWCGPCRKIAPYLDEFCNTYSDKIYVYKVNVDQQKELSALFQAKSIPMVIFVPMKGKPTSTIGAYSKDQYEEYIKQILLINSGTSKPTQGKK
jgi:thioredoxin